MSYKKTLSLLSWVLFTPLKFAIISFLLIILFIIGIGLVIPSADNFITLLTIFIAIISAAIMTLYKMPRKNMDRYGFVALNNAHILIGTTAFIIAVSLIAANQNVILIYLMWLSTKFDILLTVLTALISIFFLYLCGIFVTNIYAKYIRCREMGISWWKIICTMPFGFSLLWVPGYMLKEENKNTPAIIINAKWYNNVTEKITSNSTYTTLAFVLITAYAGLFYGLYSSILTLVSTLVFVIWMRIIGLSGFHKQFNKKYAYFAILTNIIIFISIISYYSHITSSDIHMNINDMEVTQTIN